MSVIDAALSLLDIRPDERSRVGWLLLQSIAFGISSVAIVTAGNTLFIESFGAAALPKLYVASAIVIPAAVLMLRRIERRISFIRSQALILGSIPVLLLCLRFGAAFGSQTGAAAAAGLSIGIVTTFGAIVLWSLSACLLNVRQARRLSGLLGAGQMLSFAVGGWLVPLFVARLGTVDLLLVAATANGISLATLFAVARHLPERRGPETPQEQDLPALAESSYVRLIYVFALFTVLVQFFVENMFYERVESRFENPDETAAFLGVFLGWSSLAAFGAHLGTGRLTARFGLSSCLMIGPVLIGAASAMLVIAGLWDGGAAVFWIVMTIKVLERTTIEGIGVGASMVLLQPLPANERARVQAFRQGVVTPVGIGLAGALLWFLFGFLKLTAVGVGGVLLLLTIGRLGIDLLLRTEYLKTLRAALSASVREDLAAEDPDDEPSVRIPIQEGFAQIRAVIFENRRDPERCLDRAFSLLASMYSPRSISLIRAGLARGGEQRAYAVEMLDHLLHREIKSEVLALLEPQSESRSRTFLPRAASRFRSVHKV